MEPTVFIGLDGATFSILDPLLEDGTMPFLGSLIESGVRAPLISTSNPLTPPAWTSLMTGRSPGHHGIIDFIWAEEREKDHYFTLYNFRDIRCETIWSMVSRQGGRVCALNFPMMSPPPVVAGCVVPGFVSWKHLRRNVHPPELYEELKGLPDFNPRELAWDFDLEKKASRGVQPGEYEDWLQFHIRRERHWFRIARHLMRKDRPDLTAILFDGPDKIQHIGWRFLDPALYPESPTSWERKIRDLCLGYFRELDGFLAEMVHLAGPAARVFMGSDHGFGPARIVFRVNAWLHQEGYLRWRELEPRDESAKQSIQRLVDRHFVLLDWDRTTAYARTLTSNGIYIRVAREPGHSGVPLERYEDFRGELTRRLMALKDPENGKSLFKQILTKEEAYAGPHNEQAPDLTLVLRDHSFPSILNKTPVIARRPEVEGTHYPEGVFMAHGPGIRKGFEAIQLSILDVAPLLLHSLGLPVPSDLEGRFRGEVFEESFLANRPPRKGEPTHPPASYALKQETRSAREDEERAVLEQMKALGYVE